jgi:hypothetical protein
MIQIGNENIQERLGVMRFEDTAEDQWKSPDFKAMINLKRLRDLQDFIMLNAMTTSSHKKKKKKDK